MINHSKTILLVEDSDEDYDVFKWILEELNLQLNVQRCIDADQAIEYLQGVVKHPSFILLDLNLPGTSGRELLVWLKQTPQLKAIPVIVFTTSDQARDIEFCYENGANSYLFKQVDLDGFIGQVDLLMRYWFEMVQLPK